MKVGARLHEAYAELRRRRIFGALTAYAIAAWFLVEAASVLLQAFQAPPWVLQAFIIAAFIGAPVAMAVAWVFDLTPRGFVRTADVPVPPDPAAPAQAPVPEQGFVLDARPERRQVTVLYAAIRVRGSGTGDGDPELEREVVPRVRLACVAVAEQFDGHPGVAVGNDMSVYFGVPHPHEDDALRGLRAGLAMIDAVGKLNRERPAGADVTVDLRVAVHTGTVVAEGPGASQRGQPVTLTGESVSWPGAMQVHAGSNELVATAATLRLVGDAVASEDLGERSLGDRAGAHLYRVIALHERGARAARRAGSAMVGRGRELALLEEKWARAREGSGQAVLVSGEPGIGKSSIVQGLEHVAPEQVFTAQCSPYHQQRSLYPISAMLQRDLFALEPDKGDVERTTRLEGWLRDRGWTLAEVMPLLGPFLSLPVDYPSPQLAPDRLRQALLEHLVALLLDRAESAPLHVLVEDLHWADPSTIEFLGMLLDQLPTARILLVLTYRPEFVPPWGARSHVSSLSMDRLAEADAAQIVARIAGTRDLPAPVVAKIVQRADGVPLFLEELTKAVLESGTIVGSSSGDGHAFAIPDTLQESLAARLDRLGPAKRLAQVAATIGREFSRALLSAVAGSDEAVLEQQLAALVSGEFVFRRGIGARARYVFKHALIQDAAYATLLKSSRREYHGRIAEALVQTFPQVCQAQPELVALHYAEAAMFEPAARFGLAAGQSAVRRSANGEAVNHLHRCLEAIAQLPAAPERSRLELGVQMTLMPALVATRGYGAAELEQTCSRAFALCDDVGDVPEKIFALFGLWMFHVVRANHGRSVELATKFHELAVASQDDDLLVEADLIMGIAYFFVADLATSVRHFESCGRRYDRERHGNHAYRFGQDPQVIAWSYLSWIRWLRGDDAAATQASLAAVDLARQIEHPLTLSFALSFAAWLGVYREAIQEARLRTDEVLELCEEYGIEVFLAHGRVLDGWLACEAEPSAANQARFDEGLAYFRSLGAQCFLPLWEAQRAMVAARSGDLSRARGALEQADADAAAFGERWAEPELHRARALVIRASEGPQEDADAELRKAAQAAIALGMPGWRRRIEPDGSPAQADEVREDQLQGRP